MQRLFYFLLLIFTGIICKADSLYVKRITDTLSSEAFFGRGYLKDGMGKASMFIKQEMEHLGLSVQLQGFRYPVNTFPGKAFLRIDGKSLKAGSEFIPAPGSRPCKGRGVLEKIDSNTFINREQNIRLIKSEKLTWSVSCEQYDFSMLQIQKTMEDPVSFSCDVEAVLNKQFESKNVIGTFKGTVNPDSVVVFTAHYDHLGGFGDKTYYAGANDNAAGIGLMLSIAKWYIENPPPFSVVFIAFAGEEAGLLGSKYFTEHPLIKLKNISFLINLDLVGNGEEGITIVNATEFPYSFSLIQQVNESGRFMPAIYSRGKAANSDHFWFTEKGVPSFFIYTMGKRKAYHGVDDIASTLDFSRVNALQSLVTGFIRQLMFKGVEN